MNERSIAEIIGIQYPHHCAACECDPWDSVVSVDEMLAWLLSLDAFRYPSTFNDPLYIGGAAGEYVVVLSDREGDEVSSGIHPTLTAALEEMVRRVSALGESLDVGDGHLLGDQPH